MKTINDNFLPLRPPNAYQLMRNDPIIRPGIAHNRQWLRAEKNACMRFLLKTYRARLDTKTNESIKLI
jgi:hypothetical protein